jgi:hypothetical protein
MRRTTQRRRVRSAAAPPVATSGSLVGCGVHKRAACGYGRQTAKRWWLLAALFAGYLLFAHGCHGDEENELFARLRARVTMRGGGGAVE